MTSLGERWLETLLAMSWSPRRAASTFTLRAPERTAHFLVPLSFVASIAVLSEMLNQVAYLISLSQRPPSFLTAIVGAVVRTFFSAGIITAITKRAGGDPIFRVTLRLSAYTSGALLCVWPLQLGSALVERFLVPGQAPTTLLLSALAWFYSVGAMIAATALQATLIARVLKVRVGLTKAHAWLAAVAPAAAMIGVAWSRLG